MDSVNTSAAKDDDPGTQHGHDQNLAQPARSSVASSDDGQELPKEEEKLSPEAMEKALKKARSDAARYRTERNALCESAEKWKEHEDSQKELSPHTRRRADAAEHNENC